MVDFAGAVGELRNNNCVFQAGQAHVCAQAHRPGGNVLRQPAERRDIVCGATELEVDEFGVQGNGALEGNVLVAGRCVGLDKRAIIEVLERRNFCRPQKLLVLALRTICRKPGHAEIAETAAKAERGGRAAQVFVNMESVRAAGHCVADLAAHVGAERGMVDAPENGRRVRMRVRRYPGDCNGFARDVARGSGGKVWICMEVVARGGEAPDRAAHMQPLLLELVDIIGRVDAPRSNNRCPVFHVGRKIRGGRQKNDIVVVQRTFHGGRTSP